MGIDLLNNLTVELSGDRDVIVTRLFNAPRDRVWACHTVPDLVRRWLIGPPGWTMPTCEIDLRVGGTFPLRMAQLRRCRYGDGWGFQGSAGT